MKHPTKRPKTFVGKPADIKREWHLIDLSGKVLGRVATAIVKLLTGKAKTSYSPHVDSGDYVVAINADKIAVTGRKFGDKLYRWHTGFPGGFRERTFSQFQTQDPRRIIENAVTGMLPKNKLRSERMRRLKIFIGSEHEFREKFKTNKQGTHE